MKIVKDLRLSNNITQKQMANDLGISRNYLSEIESGKITPSIKVLIQMCKYFNVNPCVLLCDQFDKTFPLCDSCYAKNPQELLRYSQTKSGAEFLKKVKDGKVKVKLVVEHIE